MATAPLTNRETRIVSLADVNMRGLEELFDEQSAEWLERLSWDYSGPSRLIREVARQHELSGVAAVNAETPVGFAFYVVDGNRCSVGDIYVSRRWRGLGVAGAMTSSILQSVEWLQRLRRIESQCVSIDNRGATEVFNSRGFSRFDRSFMMVDLHSPAFAQRAQCGRRATRAHDVELRCWHEDDFSHSARIIHRSHRDEHDSNINSQYRTEDGCLELLSILTESIWCGSFVRRVSRVAIDRETGNQAGVLIGSRISANTGHIGQISVLPAYQGTGIGRRLINAALTDFRDLGYARVSLAVTTANKRAVGLYLSCGFETIHEFPVFYREL
jgi:ribosomal protein S18 acetylase RimI-like enzyme